MVNSKYIFVLWGFFSNFKHELSQIAHMDHRHAVRLLALYVFLQPGLTEMFIKRERFIAIKHARAEHETLEIRLGYTGAETQGFSGDQMLVFRGRSAHRILRFEEPDIGRSFLFLLAFAFNVGVFVYEFRVIRFLFLFLRRMGPGHDTGNTNQILFSSGLFQLLDGKLQFFVVTGSEIVDHDIGVSQELLEGFDIGRVHEMARWVLDDVFRGAENEVLGGLGLDELDQRLSDRRGIAGPDEVA